jgi:hypothetical protein
MRQSLSSAIYKPLVADDYEWVNAEADEDYEVFLQLDGTLRASTWTPIPVRRVAADERQAGWPSDFPWLGGHVLVMRRTAVSALRDLLDSNGELLPLSTTDGVELCAFNARVIDALDEAGSTVTRFPGTRRIMHIKQVAFVATAIEGADLFRLPFRSSPTYVSARFVERVKEAGLRGLAFTQVWSG